VAPVSSAERLPTEQMEHTSPIPQTSQNAFFSDVGCIGPRHAKSVHSPYECIVGIYPATVSLAENRPRSQQERGLLGSATSLTGQTPNNGAGRSVGARCRRSGVWGTGPGQSAGHAGCVGRQSRGQRVKACGARKEKLQECFGTGAPHRGCSWSHNRSPQSFDFDWNLIRNAEGPGQSAGRVGRDDRRQVQPAGSARDRSPDGKGTRPAAPPAYLSPEAGASAERHIFRTWTEAIGYPRSGGTASTTSTSAPSSLTTICPT
jgi:hypothetical protein